MPTVAHAFGGYFVGRSGRVAPVPAADIVLMRDGDRTVVTLQATYTGPREDFALVVPVASEVRREDVKFVPRKLMGWVDTLSAPRLVEVREADPCAIGLGGALQPGANSLPPPKPRRHPDSYPRGYHDGDHGRAVFTADEYPLELVRDAKALRSRLRAHGFTAPAAVPEVPAGQGFMLVRIDPKHVRPDAAGRIVLAPLRFHYTDPQFTLAMPALPAGGSQELTIHVLAREQHGVVGRANVRSPTDVALAPAARQSFDAVYATLLESLYTRSPDAVVTEYAWRSDRCEPCPCPSLWPDAIASLGGDVLWGEPRRREPLEPPRADVDVVDEVGFQAADLDVMYKYAPDAAEKESQEWAEYRAWRKGGRHPSTWMRAPYQPILTRLRLRRSAGAASERLQLAPVPGVRGGIPELTPYPVGSARPAFQSLHLIRHAWRGPVECQHPRRGVWREEVVHDFVVRPRVAHQIAFAARDAALAELVVDLSQITFGALPDPPPGEPPPAVTGPVRCGVDDAGGLAWLVLLALRRRRSYS